MGETNVPSRIYFLPSFSASYPIILISASHIGGVSKFCENDSCAQLYTPLTFPVE